MRTASMGAFLGSLLVGVMSVCGTAGRAESDADGPLRSIAVTPTQLVARFTPLVRPAKLVELPLYAPYPSRQGATLWQGSSGADRAVLSRFAGRRDRLYSAFFLVDAATERPLGPRHFVDDFSRLPTWDFTFPWPHSKKGVTCPVNLPDLRALGVKYVDTNLLLSSLLDWRSPNPEATWEVDGRRVGINLQYVRRFDEQIKAMNEAGINVTLIILNGVPTAPDPANPLIHPHTDLAHAPNHLGAINVTDLRGLRCFRAAMEYLAHRYSAPGNPHGWVSGYIIGNELQSHWVWHNTGRLPPAEFVRDYANQLRIAWLAVRRYHSRVRVYVSMDHHWRLRPDPDPLKSLGGDEFLERLNALTKTEGDFPWNVAFHPYPENLFHPQFWRDKTAVLGFDTWRVTFKNLEVLPAFLAQERFRCHGVPRRIILSEQGFNCLDQPDGEAIQAAAYAAAYYKISRMDAIDAFILHRHVDHRAEGGLHLGLWSCRQTGPHAGAPDRKRLLWKIFRAADTPEWKQAFAFAKPILGIEDWNRFAPFTGPVPADSGTFAQPLDPKTVVYNFLDHFPDARVVNCLDWRRSSARGADGRLCLTLFQHPPADPDNPVGKAEFPLDLPPVRQDQRLEFRFGTVLTGESRNGVRFSVEVDNREVWTETQRRTNQPTAHALDLSAFADRQVTLSLKVDSLRDADHDFANWLRPVIVVRQGTSGR